MKSLFSIILLVCVTLLAFAPIDLFGAVAPVQAQATVPGPPSDVLQHISQITVGGNHTCALTTTGELHCWGDNALSQLGNNGTAPSGVPIRVAGLPSGAVQAMAAGEYHTCVVTTAGAVRCWGLHYGEQRRSTSPVEIPSLGTDLRAISAGHSSTCALTTEGQAKCWGNYPSWEPWLRIYAPPNPFTMLTVGRSHACGLTADRKVYCWGSNEHGQLGDGSSLPSSPLPGKVLGLADDIATISAGGDHTCALTSAGNVKCWGGNEFGQLGNGDTVAQQIPGDVVGLAGEVRSISAGADHTCALMKSGDVQCWGANGSGQLGDGTTKQRLLPTAALGLANGITVIATGNNHTCALNRDGTLQCWGSNSVGQLGNGSSGRSALPIAVRGLQEEVRAVSGGDLHTCAAATSGQLYCWGENGSGQLGDGTADNGLTAVAVSGLGDPVIAVNVGNAHGCALLQTGTVRCWGNNWAGQLGDGTMNDSTTPVNVTGLESGVVAISAGYAHNCALMATGRVNCWGYNTLYQLGDGTKLDRATPVEVIDLPDVVAAIGVGDAHTCVLTAEGLVKCWGSNEFGQLGRDGVASGTPTLVNGLDYPVQALAVGGNHACALVTEGRVQCWGRNQWGQLSASNRTGGYSPVDVRGLGNDIQAIYTGGDNSCVVTFANSVYCWGNNEFGQLGYGRLRYGEYNNEPTAIGALHGNVRALAIGQFHLCAITLTGQNVCWGNNRWGQLGDGSAWSMAPITVVAGLDHLIHLPVIMR